MPGRTILVVEDNPATQQAVSHTLRGDGYAVLTADDGEKALAALASADIDLVLLDMLMPGLDGWGFLKRLREGGSRVPVVVTTAVNLTREWAESYGCQGFLKKPYDEDALLAEVRGCLAP